MNLDLDPYLRDLRTFARRAGYDDDNDRLPLNYIRHESPSILSAGRVAHHVLTCEPMNTTTVRLVNALDRMLPDAPLEVIAALAGRVIHRIEAVALVCAKRARLRRVNKEKRASLWGGRTKRR
jgi:hypothetical protein